MSETQDQNQSNTADLDSAENPAMQALEASHNPKAGLEKARNAAEGKADNAAGGVASSTAQDHVPGTSDPEASDLPSSDGPLPD